MRKCYYCSRNALSVSEANKYKVPTYERGVYNLRKRRIFKTNSLCRAHFKRWMRAIKEYTKARITL